MGETTQGQLAISLGARYRADALLGEGGMGVVYRGTDLELDRAVAIKVIRPEYAHEPSLVSRMLAEGRAAAQLRSRHTARILDLGKSPAGSPFLVLELLEGHDLEREIAMNGPLPVRVAVEYVLQACEALAEAHALGIVHRDLKPENLFLAREANGAASVKVLDFGISRRTNAPSRLTSPETTLGSPHYMAPEQVRGKVEVDARADVYALGAVLFELLTGRTVFTGADAAALCASVLLDQPQPLHELRPEAPAELSAIVLRCLEKDREARYESVTELARALAMCVETPVGAVLAAAPFSASNDELGWRRIGRATAPRGEARSSGATKLALTLALPSAGSEVSGSGSAVPPSSRFGRALRATGFVAISALALVGMSLVMGGAGAEPGGVTQLAGAVPAIASEQPMTAPGGTTTASSSQVEVPVATARPEEGTARPSADEPRGIAEQSGVVRPRDHAVDETRSPTSRSPTSRSPTSRSPTSRDVRRERAQPQPSASPDPYDLRRFGGRE